MPLALLLSVAYLPASHAAYVTAVSEEVTIGLSGNFARMAVADDGSYSLFWGAGGDYNRIPLDPDFSYNDQERVALTGHTDFVDHAIRPCPDGTWLGAASANVVDPNDTAYIYTLDANFDKTNEVLLDAQNPDLAHNDMPLWCGDKRLTGFSGHDGLQYIFELNADGSEADQHSSSSLPQMQGGQFYRAEAEDSALYTVGATFTNGVELSIFDAEFNLVEMHNPPISPPGQYSYWPQGFLRVGHHFVLIHMARSESDTWDQDTGNVYLTILSMADWSVVEQVNLTNYSPGKGAMRPWAVRDGNDLLVSYDVDLHPHILRVTLDSGALGETADSDSGGTGTIDTGVGGGECGCASPATGGTGAGGTLFLTLAGVLQCIVSRRPRPARPIALL
ncbi:MAG: hypothetical protein EXR69_15550 [Myxococcales bacterium]|nr:hypothetical protein [Myxococcales bacterium]